MKIAVCTTFPNNQWDVCAAEMLASFKAYWPQDIKLFIQVDEQSEDSFNELNNNIVRTVGEDRCFIASAFDDEQKAFIDRWKDLKAPNYRFEVVKFSNKVFALEKCADALKDTHDILIWLDADVITKRTIDLEWLKDVLPKQDEVCTYLGREGFYSECGWVAYNLKNGAYDLLKKMRSYYTEDTFKEIKTGWTDCHVFDAAREGLNCRNLSSHYVKDESDIDVWPFTKLAERLVHRKGHRKHIAAQNKVKQVAKEQKAKIDVVDSDKMQIKTRNCLDHKKIIENVKTNLGQIRSWVGITAKADHDIVICAAGPSLIDHIDEIREKQNNGAKIIAVKHAIDTLKLHKIKPWGVVLLDPRGHVEGFVKAPDPDVVYFVASMCDPSVVKTLNDNKCKVIGYHALVNAGETEVMIPSDLTVSGGSATSTRAIGLFSDMFGYKNFHLYGYDLCYYQKPDLNEKNPDGNPKYMEINIGTHTYGNKYLTRTFWTEGQFLAQSNELKDLYKSRKDLNITLYGDGMAGWLYKHHKAHKKYLEEHTERLNQKRRGNPTLDEFVNAVSRGSEFSRGV
jgi:hypothetical protein